MSRLDLLSDNSNQITQLVKKACLFHTLNIVIFIFTICYLQVHPSNSGSPGIFPSWEDQSLKAANQQIPMKNPALPKKTISLFGQLPIRKGGASAA